VTPDEILPAKRPADPEIADPIDEAVPAEGLRMPIIEHLRELRVRLIRSAIALTVGFIVAYFFSDQLFTLLTMPIRQVAHGKLLLIGTGVGEAFYTKIKVSLVAGLFLASPAVFWEIWRFIAPGLYQTERKMAFPFIIFATIFFVSGGYFCWAVVFKIGYAFFLEQYSSIGVTPTIRISEYLAFSAKLMLAFAITFEMPIFAFFLTRLGIVDYKMMLKQFRYAILIIFVISAALTPPDMVSQFLLAIPLLLLYVISVGVSYVFRAKAEPAGAVENPAS
jgi:sec-independent protein translocase protein TatC